MGNWLPLKTNDDEDGRDDICPRMSLLTFVNSQDSFRKLMAWQWSIWRAIDGRSISMVVAGTLTIGQWLSLERERHRLASGITLAASGIDANRMRKKRRGGALNALDLFLMATKFPLEDWKVDRARIKRCRVVHQPWILNLSRKGSRSRATYRLQVLIVNQPG